MIKEGFINDACISKRLNKETKRRRYLLSLTIVTQNHRALRN